MRLTAIGNDDIRSKLDEMTNTMAPFENKINSVLANIQPVLEAKQAGGGIFGGSDTLLANGEKTVAAYESIGSIGNALAILAGLLGLVGLALFAYINNNETKRRALLSETENKRNQEAILRLLNELGDLSEGDLTPMPR
jgi:hypothetical protein